MRARVFNLFLGAAAVFIWSCVLFTVFIISIISDIYKYFGDGILKYIAIFLFAIAALLPILFYKKIKNFLSLSIAFICNAILAFAIFCSVLVCARIYISDFSTEKWLNNEKLRIYMISDFEREYSFIGKNQEDIMALLGRPTYIEEEGYICYKYYVGESFIDPITYDITFIDGAAVSAKLTEH